MFSQAFIADTTNAYSASSLAAILNTVVFSGTLLILNVACYELGTVLTPELHMILTVTLFCTLNHL